MQIWLEELAMLIITWFLRIIDGIMQLFNAFCGLTPVYDATTGESTSILGTIFNSSRLMQIFWSVFVIALFLLALFSIIALIRNMLKNDKQISNIIGKVLIALVGIFVSLALVYICIMLCEELVVLFDDALKGESNLTFVQTLFNAFVAPNNWRTGYNATMVTWVDANGESTSLKVSKILGDYSKMLGFVPKDWADPGTGWFKDPDDFYYLPALVGVVFVSWEIFKVTLSLGKRCFELVFEFFCMPAAFACMPLDDGSRVKNWTDSMLGRLVVIFGYVLSINVFTIVMPLVNNLEIGSNMPFVNCMFRVILCCSGACLIPEGGRMFERIFVSREEAFFDASNNRGAGMLMGMAKMAGGKAMHTATRAAVGGGKGIAKGVQNHKAKKEQGAYRDQNALMQAVGINNAASGGGASGGGSYADTGLGGEALVAAANTTETPAFAEGGGNAGGGGAEKMGMVRVNDMNHHGKGKRVKGTHWEAVPISQISNQLTPNTNWRGKAYHEGQKRYKPQYVPTKMDNGLGTKQNGGKNNSRNNQPKGDSNDDSE